MDPSPGDVDPDVLRVYRINRFVPMRERNAQLSVLIGK